MLDFSHVPSNTNHIQRFEANSPSAAAGWSTWIKPRGVKFVHIMSLGGGGGGSPGVVGAAATAGGGGGGGSSGWSSNIFPAHNIPDTLYVSVGFGGAASATPTVASGNGIQSVVSLYTSLLTTPLTNATLSIAAGGGGAGIHSGATAGPSGVAGILASIAAQNLASLGSTYGGLAGVAGTAGGSTAAGVPPGQPLTGQILLAAGGGGGLGGVGSTGANGGRFAGNTAFPAVLGGDAGGTTTANGNDGSHGIQPIPGLFYFYGGSGGASGGGVGGNGGNGGDGAYGCGGGGGGAALTSFNAGAGGRGGNGLVIISCW